MDVDGSNSTPRQQGIVRRVSSELAGALAPRGNRHAGQIITVYSELTEGINQRVVLTWRVPLGIWRQNYVLLGFRSSSGFAASRSTQELSAHGQLVLEKREDGTQEEHLSEGTYYYTFILTKKVLLGCFEKTADIVRFSETVPSLSLVIKRLEDKKTLQGLVRHEEIAQVRHETELLDAARALEEARRRLKRTTRSASEGDEVIEQAIDKIRLEARTFAKLSCLAPQIIAEVERDVDFVRLNPIKRKQVLKRIREICDPEEQRLEP